MTFEDWWALRTQDGAENKLLARDAWFAGQEVVNKAWNHADAARDYMGPGTCDAPGSVFYDFKFPTGEWYCHGCGASQLEPRCKYRKSVPSPNISNSESKP